MTIRLANNNDLETILDIYACAREQMRLSGNPRQWGNNRPSPETVRKDIQKEQAYVIVEENRICGVFVFVIGPDPTYQFIENGAWLNDEPYGALHRIAGNGQAKGILAMALSFCESRAANIRVDTHDDNQIMRHLLAKYGYQKCGYIYVEDGSRRIAYQKQAVPHAF
ncbi:MAG: N-acetyltransferase [Blautia sp.]|nr:N-acetyltransferase [Blautia sp.]MCM1201852.1 GNAT family N-acetyltransferase [Bacteroides fragilis]